MEGTVTGDFPEGEQKENLFPHSVRQIRRLADLVCKWGRRLLSWRPSAIYWGTATNRPYGQRTLMDATSGRRRRKGGRKMNLQKFKKLVHYVCWRCSSDPTKLGAVKLNKILWFADASRYYSTGEALTGVRYVRRQYGPVPAPILPVLRELEEEGKLTIQDAKFHGLAKKEYIVHQEADEAFLSPDERTLVEEIIEYVCSKHTAKSVSIATHNSVWEVASDGETIPYFTVFVKPGKITDEDRKWAYAQLAGAHA